MPKTRLAGEFGEVGTGTQADLRFCRLPVRPRGRSGPTDTGPLAELSYYKYCHYWLVRSSNSCLIGLLTATGKQIHLDRLHRRPIQWHLKNNWRVPESLEKVIPIPRCCTHIYKGGCKRTMSLQANHYTQIKHDLQILQIHQKQGGVLT